MAIHKNILKWLKHKFASKFYGFPPPPPPPERKKSCQHPCLLPLFPTEHKQQTLCTPMNPKTKTGKCQLSQKDLHGHNFGITEISIGVISNGMMLLPSTMKNKQPCQKYRERNTITHKNDFICFSFWNCFPLQDTEELYSKLPNVVGMNQVPLDTFNHVDFQWAKDAKTLLYNDLIKFMKNYWISWPMSVLMGVFQLWAPQDEFMSVLCRR
jgi:hypothetical protein